MSFSAFIGDEVSAAGFRLAGVEVHVPESGQASDLFERLLARSQLLMVTAEVAAQLPEAQLRRALIAGRPLVLVVPDVRGRVPPDDLAARLRRQLGMAE
jgi:vacuolar-type H+-ATPase subunit F/Vma7